MNQAAGFTTADLAEGLRRIAAGMESSAEELNALDAKLGDGDLGVTMSRGFTHVLAAVPNFSTDVGQALTACAQAFTKESGSSFGTLLAFGLMSAAKSTKGQTVVPWPEVSDLLRRAFDTMSARGKASLGDKTVLDVLEASASATQGLSEPSAVLRAALAATQETMDRLRNKPAQIGRARIFGDKSIGLDDPGMVVFRAMLQALAGEK